MVSVIAVNSSPKMNKGNTALVLKPFLEGMRSEGAEVELFYTKKLDIKPCTGEFKCWGKTPGKCYIKDDMQRLLPKFRNAEIWVLAIPVYVPMPGEMQNLINRLMPLFESAVVVRNGRMFPRMSKDVKLKKIVLVSTASFWEVENFDALVGTVEKISETCGVDFAGALLRPHADVFARMTRDGRGANEVLVAAKQAGSSLIAKGRMS
ncbi:MAG: flavodoxin family protein, partial [Candidatus Thermoplasmatota archaeon]|nr:flavodoxin family protein [Candidatus Thermoplasmatota archaeon]